MPLVSVVITTKNRVRTALPVVREILSYDDDFELVVQDCSDDASLEEALGPTLTDGRLRYERTPPVSMTANWNRAVARTTGAYLVIIGDDDLVLPELFAAARWAEQKHIQSVSYRWSSYHWPDFPDSGLASKVRVGAATGAVTWRDAAVELERSARGYGSEIERLPHVYHGLTHRSVFEGLKQQTGEYFFSLAPDYYSAFAVAASVARFPQVDFPLSIMGHSGASNSARVQVRKVELDQHLREYGAVSWQRWVPPYSSGQTVMADAMLIALTNTNPALLRGVELSRVYAATLLERPKTAPALLERLEAMRRELKRGRLDVYGHLAVALAGKGVMRAGAALRRHTGRSEGEADGYANDITTASQLIRARVADTRSHLPF